jgi:hypothetical protein
MNEASSSPRGFALLAVTVVGLWVGAGALFKLFAGSPADLPPVVRGSALGPDLTFRVAIAVELAVALAALLSPRFAWPLATGLLGVFLAVLVQLLLSGAASCGCFGSKVKVHPGLMLGIDGGLLLALLASRPWSSLRGLRLRLPAVAPAFLLAAAAPWLVLQPLHKEQGAVRDESGAWKFPEKPWPRYEPLEPPSWIGKSLQDTTLGRWLDTEGLPGDAQWILYRINCSHCAEHLRKLAAAFDGTVVYVLVRVPEEGDEAAIVVHEKPPALEVALPSEIVWVIQTPWQLDVAGGAVKGATQHR